MDYPHGRVNHHHHHNHHHRRNNSNDDNEIYPPPPPQIYPPPPSYDGRAYDPPPPHMESSIYPPPSYVHQSSHPVYPPYRAPEPIFSEYQNYPPPSYAHQNSSHEEAHHSFKPHMPGFIGSHFHHGPEKQGSSSTHSYDAGPEMGLGLGLAHLANRPTLKMYCKAGGERYVVGVRDDKLVLTHPDHSDLTQHWYKDEKYSTRVKDKEGHPSFMLVNKGTGQAVKHSLSCYPVQLAPYKPDVIDEAVLWTESRDLGSGFRTIKTVNNIHLIMDAWNADKDHGGIHDGTVVALYETWKGDNQNQQWKLVRH